MKNPFKNQQGQVRWGYKFFSLILIWDMVIPVIILGIALAFTLAFRILLMNMGIMDGDGQHQVQDMEKLILKARSCGKSLILGTRQISEKMPLRSRFGNTITRNIFRLMTGTAVSDTQSGLRAFSSEMNREFCEVSGERYEYETEVLLYCAKQKIPIVEVPIETIYRDKENSTSHFRVIRDSFRIYKEFIKE